MPSGSFDGASSKESVISISRYQGYLLKKRKVGFHLCYVVLYRGNLIYYNDSSDAEKDVNRRKTYCLQGASVLEEIKFKHHMSYAGYSFLVNLMNSKPHTLFAITVGKYGTMKINIPTKSTSKSARAVDAADRKKKWMSAFQEHIEYATKIKQFDRMDEHLNIQIGNIEKNITVLMNKLSEIRKKPKGSTRQSQDMFSPTRSNANATPMFGNEFDDDSQIGSSLNDDNDDESYDTAEEYESEDSFSASLGEESAKSTELQVCITEPLSKKYNSQTFQIDLESWRTRLPSKQPSLSVMTIMPIIRQLIGKELVKMTIPAVFCEPLSILHRVGESFQYAYLLSRAARSPDPLKRMEFVASYLFAAFACVERMSIPFNPLLGETYELTREDLGFRLICETFSMQPPGCAFHGESLDPNARWTMFGSTSAKYKLCGTSVEVVPNNSHTIFNIPELDETYSCTSCTYLVHSVIFGPTWIEHTDNVEITCAETGYKTVFNYKPFGKYKQYHRYDGYIVDNHGKKVRALFGEWNKNLYSCEPLSYATFNMECPRAANSSEDPLFDSIRQNPIHGHPILQDLTELWIGMELPPYYKDYFWLGYFAMSLNEMTDELERILPRTDSRYRKDIKFMENGKTYEASQEKIRLEESRRKAADQHKVMWFKQHKETGDLWVFTNEYWKRDFSNCPNIY